MTTNTDTQRIRGTIEIIKWLVVTILLIIAIVGNYIYRDIIPLLRIIIVVTLVSVASGIAFLTTKGKVAMNFIREARVEICKVVWPTSRETLYTTLVVIFVTILISLLLWGLDDILFRFISLITTILRF